jgi:hypothetical protein
LPKQTFTKFIVKTARQIKLELAPDKFSQNLNSAQKQALKTYDDLATTV